MLFEKLIHFVNKDSHKPLFGHISEFLILNHAFKRVLNIVIKRKTNGAHWCKRESKSRIDKSHLFRGFFIRLKNAFQDFSYISILFVMTTRDFLQLSSFKVVQNIVVSPFKNIEQHDHFLILKQIKTACIVAKRVTLNHFLKLNMELFVHWTKDVSIRFSLRFRRNHRRNVLPISLRAWKSYNKESKTKVWDQSCVE